MGPEVSSPGRARDVDLHTLGVGVRLRCSGDDADGLARTVRRAWSATLSAPCVDAVVIDVVVTADPGTRARARAEGAVTARSVATALHRLSGRVTLAAIERQAGRLWLLHGAAVADPVSGRAVALVGAPGTGVSTASRALGRRFGYVTDETTAVAPDLAILPHPKPLSIARTGNSVKEQLAPEDAGLLPTPATPTLAAVLVLHRDAADGSGVGTERLRTSMALAALAPETSYLGRLPRPLSFVAGIIEQTTGVFETHYAEAADLEPVVAELLA